MVLGWAATRTRMPEPKFNGCKSTRMMGEQGKNEKWEWNWSHRWNGRQWIDCRFLCNGISIEWSRSSRLCETANRYHAKSKVSNHKAILSPFVKCCSSVAHGRRRVHFIVNTSIIRVRIRQQSIWNGVCFHELFIILKSSQVINAPEQKTAEKENSRSRCDKRMC